MDGLAQEGGARGRIISSFLCGAVNESPFVLRDGNRSRDDEVDFDVNPTGVYVAVHTRQWELACERVKMYPCEAATWVVRYCSTAEEDTKDLGEIVLEGSGSLSSHLGGGGEVTTGQRAQRWRMLPLHASLLFNGHIEVVQALINANPKACAAADDQGMLPLHVAFRAGAPEEIVLALLSAHPEAIERVDDRGRLPSMLAPKECVTYRDTIIDAFVRGPAYYYWSVRVATADQVRGEIAMHARIKAIEERARSSADHYKELLESTGKYSSKEAESLLIENNRLKEQIAFYESKYECAEEKERVLVEHTNSLAERLRLTSLSEEHFATEVEKLESRLQDEDISIRKIREVSLDEKRAFEDMVAHLSKNLVKAERKVKKLTEVLDVKVKEANKMQVSFYKLSQEEEHKIFKNDCQSGCEILKSEHEKECKNLNLKVELDTRRESELEVVTHYIKDQQIIFEEADELCSQLSVFQSVQQSNFEETGKADNQDMNLAFHSENEDIVAKNTTNSPLSLEEQLNQYYQLNHVKVQQEKDVQKLFDSRLSNMNSEHKMLGKAFEDSAMVKNHVEWNIQGQDVLFDTYTSTNSFSSSVNIKSAACIPSEEDYEFIKTNSLLHSNIDMTLRELTTEQTSLLESLDLSGSKEQILEMLGKVPGLTKTQVNLLVDVACSLVT